MHLLLLPALNAKVSLSLSLSVPGFDEYFLGLRPPLLLSDCKEDETSSNRRRLRRPSVNCRNPWFRQFWSHHFHCHFRDQSESEMPAKTGGGSGDRLNICTGRERLTKYEQEGLVPFVGE